MAKKLILVIGAPGSGKSTDSELLAKRHTEDITTISVGDLLRDEIKRGTGVGKIAEKYVATGDNVPGQVVVYEIFGLISNAPKDIVLIDGFPRSIDQMKELGDELFYSKDIDLVSVIEIRITRETARKRVLSDNASDEEVKRFEHKMDVYTNLIEEIENYYSEENLLTVVDGEQGIEDIVSQIDEYLKTQVHLFT